MTRAFLGTNILVYAVTADPRRDIAERWLLDRPHLSVQALNEFAHVARRKLGFGWTEVEDALASFRVLAAKIHPITPDDNQRALALAQSHALGWYDALMLSVALAGGADMFVSEDMQDGLLVSGRLRIVDPFRDEPV